MRNAETALPLLSTELSRSCSSLEELRVACDICARQHRLSRIQHEFLWQQAEAAFLTRLAAAS